MHILGCQPFLCFRRACIIVNVVIVVNEVLVMHFILTQILAVMSQFQKLSRESSLQGLSI